MRFDLKHNHPWPAHLPFCHDRGANSALGHRLPGIHLRLLHLTPIHQHEHFGLRRCHRRTNQQCQHHCQHPSTNVHQLRCCFSLPRHRFLHSRSLSLQSIPNDSRHSQCLLRPRRIDHPLHDRLSRIEKRRRRHRFPTPYRPNPRLVHPSSCSSSISFMVRRRPSPCTFFAAIQNPHPTSLTHLTI